MHQHISMLNFKPFFRAIFTRRLTSSVFTSVTIGIGDVIHSLNATALFVSSGFISFGISYPSTTFRKVFAVLIVIISPILAAADFFHQFDFAYCLRSKDQNAAFSQISTFSSSAVGFKIDSDVTEFICGFDNCF